MDARLLHDSLKDDWHIFHLIVETASTKEQDAVRKWRELLGERAIVVSDVDNLAEIIVSLIQVVSGANPEEIVNSSTKIPARPSAASSISLSAGCNEPVGGSR